MVENFNQALKEIGDVENWAERIEADMHSISQGLEFVQGVLFSVLCHCTCTYQSDATLTNRFRRSAGVHYPLA